MIKNLENNSLTIDQLDMVVGGMPPKPDKSQSSTEVKPKLDIDCRSSGGKTKCETTAGIEVRFKF